MPVAVGSPTWAMKSLETGCEGEAWAHDRNAYTRVRVGGAKQWQDGHSLLKKAFKL